MKRIDVYQGLDGLEKLKEAWKKITNRERQWRFFQQFEWYEAYLKYLEPDACAVHFFLVSEDEKPVAIIPLKYDKKKYGILNLKAWRVPRTELMDLYDFVCISQSKSKECFEVVLDLLSSEKEYKYDIVLLDQILEGGDTCSGTFSLNYKTIGISTTTSKYLACNDDADGSATYGSSKFRRNLRRLEKKLDKKGDVRYHLAYCTKKNREEFEEFLKVEGSGWKGAEGTKTAIMLDERSKGFYQELMGSFGAKGNCVINELSVNEKVIAGQFCLVDDWGINLLKIGYDQEFHDTAPGFLLIKKVFKSLCVDKGVKELSFVTGAKWNDAFKPSARKVYSAYIFCPSITGYLVYYMMRLKKIIKSQLKK